MLPAKALPDEGGLRSLAEWEPPLGVMSVAVSADPGDRSEGWRAHLKDGLTAIVAAHEGDEHELRLAVRDTAKSLIGRFADDAPPPARTVVGFIEVSRNGGAERWYGAELALDRFLAELAARPNLGPLVELVDLGRPRGIVVLSSERVRLLELSAGRSAEVRAFELSTYEPSWRESGKESHDRRLDANRDRWLGDVAAEVADWSGGDGRRREILVVGDAAIAERFIADLGADVEASPIAEVDLISEPEHVIAERVAGALSGLERTRQLSLVEQAGDAARAGGRGALAVQETAQALAEGRVDRLLIDPERSFEPDAELAAAIGVADGDWEPERWLIETAITTGAAITSVRGDAAEALAADGGVAAILRY